MHNRASQFMPFDALKGFKEALKKVEEIKINKKDILEDLLFELESKLNSLKIGDIIKVEYYYNFEYIKTIGRLKKIDRINNFIYIDNSKILINDIIDIEKYFTKENN